MAHVVRGYHGTTLTNATAITNGTFEYSKGPDEWLGTGIYFFEASRAMAWAWAKRAVRECEKKTGVIDRPAILAADIELRDCIDLCDLAWARELENTAKKLDLAPGIAAQHGLRLTTAGGRQFIIADTEMPPTAFRDNKADCQVVNALWDSARASGPAPACVRAPFVFGRQTHTNSFFFNQSHVQIAVIDAAILSGVAIER